MNRDAPFHPQPEPGVPAGVADALVGGRDGNLSDAGAAAWASPDGGSGTSARGGSWASARGGSYGSACGGTWAITPLKAPDLAKTRLAALLSPAQRRELFFALAARVLDTLRATPGIDAVVVVSGSDEVTNFAAARGALVLAEPAAAGTAAAFDYALAQLRPARPRRVLMIAGDLPSLTPAALTTLLAAGDDHEVVIAPDRHRTGTNALLCTPPGLVAPSFGPDSFWRHLTAAGRAGAATAICPLPELSLDLDGPADLAALRLQDPVAAAALGDILSPSFTAAPSLAAATE